ncbi:hypothetical protein Avbf_18445 [Armadillidium vulgare]|nr:hypothetical protein Avbf_04254 [Armadillidium vulgare]RXG56920.1 hypothetical protein Avbf_18445 [Armadillidium vulgare]
MNSRVLFQRCLQNQNIIQRRSIIAGYPRNRVSLAEKISHGLAISVGILFIPSWVLVNLKHYKGEQ